MSESWEKLGLFYLGRAYDLDAGEASTTPTLYDARDLTTHAVCVGMTGSGKTGLCIGLLEEAAIDGVPAIALDLKGDIANLLLTFPELAPADFKPWVLEEDARRKGRTLDEHAEAEATKWREGLASWGQAPERIQRLRDAAEFTIYTPGSTAGRPLSILSSFGAPGPEVRDDVELLAERVSTTVAGVLGLLGVEADPVRSRETILLSQLLTDAWREGRDVDLAMLIGLVQAPPFERVGVLELETFYPQKDRFGLAMQLNNLLASPTFASWMEGEPLDVDRLLYTEDGRPRVSIVSVAHLAPAERMFFLSLLLNETLGWMRQQSGTTNLRALLYIDEIFGYLPPTAVPPTKKPLLTLLKQARAFGLGLVLATQNPVDIDYKALSNAGTWFVGRLQTERDKLRVLEALDSASAEAGSGMDRGQIDRILSGLGKRVFLLHNVHEEAPQVFQTRWAMSYLRGPMTRAEIKRLGPWDAGPSVVRVADDAQDVQLRETGSVVRVADDAQGVQVRETGSVVRMADDAREVAPPPGVGGGVPAGMLVAAPAVDAKVTQAFAPLATAVPDGRHLAWRACVFADADVLYTHRKSNLTEERAVRLVATFADGPVPVDWSRALPTGVGLADLDAEPAEAGGWWVPPPSVATKATSFTQWQRALKDHIYRDRPIELRHAPSLDLWSRPGESERDWQIRLADAARGARAAATDALRDAYATKFRKLDERIDTASRRLEREKSQASRATTEAVITTGSSLLGALFGGRRSTRTAMSKASRAQNQRDDVREAEARLAALHQERQRLQAELDDEAHRLAAGHEPGAVHVETVAVTPFKKDIAITGVALLWIPLAVDANGADPQLLARLT